MRNEEADWTRIIRHGPSSRLIVTAARSIEKWSVSEEMHIGGLLVVGRYKSLLVAALEMGQTCEGKRRQTRIQ